MSVTTENVRRAVTLLQEIVLLDRAITSDTAQRGRELVEAARLDLERVDAALDSPVPTERIQHTYQPRATEIDVDVAITTTGRTLAVKVGVAAQPGECDESVQERARALSLAATQDVIAAYAAAGLTFGKVEAGSR